MRHALTAAGRYLVMRTTIPDRPGGLLKLLELVAAERGNIVDVEHHREGMDLQFVETEVQLTVVTRDEAHCAGLCAAMEAQGYHVERLS
jgi:threonine dehydratase